jgi:hypothetical protein
MNKLSTTLQKDSDNSPIRIARCDDNGVMQVTLVSSNTSNSTVSPTSTTTKVSKSFARPSDSLAYLSGDVIGPSTSTTAALELPLIGNVGSVIRVTGTRLKVDVGPVPAGMTSFRLHLYSALPPSALVDSASWDLSAGDRTIYLGYVDLGSPSDFGSTLYVQQTGLDYDFQIGGTTSLWGYLVTATGFTPTSAAVKNITLYILGM